MPVLLRIAAAAGLAVALAHLLMAPGGIPGRAPAGLVATVTAPAFLPALLGFAALLLLLGPVLERRIGPRRLRIALEALAGLLALPLLQPLGFRSLLWPLLAAVTAIACWRLAGIEGPPPAPRSTDTDPSSPAPHGPDTARARVGARARREQLLGALITLAAGLLLLMGAPPTQGDEPHYLLVTHSIWQDGDIDLADDYAAREDLAFHRGAISPHYKPGLDEGSRYSMHGVGYPLLLLPAYAIGRRVDGGSASVLLARLLQVVVLALAAWLLVGWAAEHTDPRSALGGTLLVTVLAPVVFAPVSLFPETPAMFLAVAGFIAARSRSRAGAMVGGLAVAVLPWMGVKYIPLAGAVAVGALIAAGRRPGPRQLAAVLAPLAISLGGHALFTLSLYGSLSPSAIYLGADPAFGRQPGYGADWWAYVRDWPGALRTLIGYFFDQKEGLFLLAPQYLLAAAGVGAAWRRRPAEVAALVLIATAHLGPYALSQQIGGQSPPARPLMAILWITVLPLALALRPVGGRLLAVCRGALPALGLAMTLALALDPALLPHDYPVTEAWLLRDLSPEGGELWRTFPLWLNLRGGGQWVATLLWTAGLTAMLAAIARSARSAAPASGRRLAWRGAAVGLVLVALVAGYSARLVVTARHVGAEVAPGIEAWVVRAVPERAWAEPGGVWIAPGPPREVVLVVDRALSAPGGAQLDLRLRTLRSGTVLLGAAGMWNQERIEAGPPVARSIPLGSAYPWRGRSAYRILLGAAEGVEPARLDGGGDWRPLGVFLQVVGLSENGEGGQ